MLVLKYNNSATLGNDVNTASQFNVGNFTGNSYISVDDFRNASNTTITIQEMKQNNGMYLSKTSGTSFSGGPPAPGEIAPFWLLVHPNETINAQGGYDTTYKYDGCRFQCYPSSNSSGHLMGYRQNTLTYDFQPIFQYVCGGGSTPSDNIPVSRILSVEWVGIFNSELKTCTALRPLYVINMNGIPGYDGYTIQCFYGPLVPASTVSEWFSEIRQQDDNDDPNDNPDDGDSQDAEAPEGVNWSWLNQFKIMNWSAEDPWPAKMLVDVPSNAGVLYWYNNHNDYLAWNDNNDGEGNYHGSGVCNTAGYRDSEHAIVTKIAELHEWGTNLLGFDKISSDSGKFIEYYDFNTDPVTGTYTRFGAEAASSEIIVNDDMNLKWTMATWPGLTISNNGSSFNVSTNYPNFTLWDRFNLRIVGGVATDAVCIIRYENHYYLGGVCGLTNNQNNSGYLGFAIICRIDKLKDMPGYGGPDPDDPGNVGGDPDSPGIDPDDTFGNGDGPGIGPNPDTDKRTDDSTGDGTEDPDPDIDDGNDDPDDDPDPDPDPDPPPGTGEKQTNPVNTKTKPNTHDGSVGNGTGDPHQGDDIITDPGTTLPSGGSTGTIGGAGFLSIFTPTQAELTAFSGELFSTSALTAIKQYFSSNPMDGIFGLHMVPFTGFASGVTANPRIGTYDFSTPLTLAGEEFLNVDYGELYIPFVYDGYENFAPQSDAKIFLPFIGTKDIDINIIQGCKIHLKYNVSLVTGDIYAYLYCQWASRYQDAGIEQGIDHLIYHWQGNCAVSIPISHVDSSNYISGAMQIAGGITSLAAGAVAGSPFTIPSGITGVTQGIAEMGRSSIITSGNISGVAAFMGSREPYLILSRPIIAFNSKYNHYLGRKSNAIMHIRALSEGSYTVMRNVDLSGVTATNDELQQIEGFLKGGFYV